MAAVARKNPFAPVDDHAIAEYLLLRQTPQELARLARIDKQWQRLVNQHDPHNLRRECPTMLLFEADFFLDPKTQGYSEVAYQRILRAAGFAKLIVGNQAVARPQAEEEKEPHPNQQAQRQERPPIFEETLFSFKKLATQHVQRFVNGFLSVEICPPSYESTYTQELIRLIQKTQEELDPSRSPVYRHILSIPDEAERLRIAQDYTRSRIEQKHALLDQARIHIETSYEHDQAMFEVTLDHYRDGDFTYPYHFDLAHTPIAMGSQDRIAIAKELDRGGDPHVHNLCRAIFTADFQFIQRRKQEILRSCLQFDVCSDHFTSSDLLTVENLLNALNPSAAELQTFREHEILLNQAVDQELARRAQLNQ